jgi:hypothetical protein
MAPMNLIEAMDLKTFQPDEIDEHPGAYHRIP